MFELKNISQLNIQEYNIVKIQQPNIYVIESD